MVCIPLYFVFITSVNPCQLWQYQMCDSMNRIMLENNTDISFYPSTGNGLTVNFYDVNGVNAHAVGYTGSHADMINQIMPDYWPYKLMLHEIGHVLGLPHTFGFCAPNESGTACDDGFSDTPAESGLCADSCSRNVMGYNVYQDYFSPQQIAAIHYHLNTDTLYTGGIFLPDFGMSVAQFSGPCGDMGLINHDPPADYPVKYYDFSGREIMKPERGFYVAVYPGGTAKKYYITQ